MSVTLKEYRFFRSFSTKIENWPMRKAEALWRRMRERKIAGMLKPKSNGKSKWQISRNATCKRARVLRKYLWHTDAVEVNLNRFICRRLGIYGNHDMQAWFGSACWRLNPCLTFAVSCVPYTMSVAVNIRSVSNGETSQNKAFSNQVLLLRHHIHELVIKYWSRLHGCNATDMLRH